MSGWLIAVWLSGTLAGGPADSLVATSPCQQEIARQLESWHATDEILRAPAGPLGGDIFRIATDELGVWITLHLSRGSHQTVSLFLSESEGTTRLDYDERCEPVETRALAPEIRDDSFTDADLKARLDEDPRLVVYLWSPHLPLSVDGYHEIERAAASLSVPFVAVVDPAAVTDYVKRTGEEAGIPANAQRPVGSVELLFRELTVHAPAILVFTGRGASATLPGYRNADAYRVHLRDLLE